MRGDLNDSLKQGLGKTDTYSGGRNTRRALIVVEMALSLDSAHWRRADDPHLVGASRD